MDEWAELKLRVQELRSTEPTLCYWSMWQRILKESKSQSSLTNVLALVRTTLVIPLQTATQERGFSLMNRVKTDWRNRLKLPSLSQLMMIKLNGPDISNFNAEPVISQWWKEGPRSRRPSSRPYSHRTQPDQESEDNSSDPESDLDS